MRRPTPTLIRTLPVLCLAVSGCFMQQQTYDRSTLPMEGDELPILHQVTGTHCHETRAMQIVIRDAAMLARIPLEDVQVNFAREMLLIVTLGRVPSDQFSVRVGRVRREGSRLKVRTMVERPPPGAPIVMASPYCIAVVPTCDLNVDGFLTEPPTRERTWQPSEPPAGW